MYFFVVLLEESNKYVIVPENWVRDLEKIVFEKCAKYGLNSDQLHLCYYSTQENAQDERGEPNPLFPPNFNAPLAIDFPCEEGTFQCRILKYTRKLIIDI